MKDAVLWNVQAPQRAPSEEQWELEEDNKFRGIYALYMTI